MNIIRTDELRAALFAALAFDREHSKCISESDGQFTGNFWHETYEGFGIEITYYFQGAELTAYEYDVEKQRELDKQAMDKYLQSPAGQRRLKRFAKLMKGQK